MKTTAKTITIKARTVNCPKCSGSGRISAFSHVAGGVCFCCKGAGSLRCEEYKAKLSADTVKKADWVMSSTPASYEKLSYAKQLKIREFCHGGFGLQEAYPELLAHWRAVGQDAFNVAQDARHDQVILNGDWMPGSAAWERQQELRAAAA